MSSSPALAGLFNGRPIEKQLPAKRKVNKDTPANVTKRLRKDAQGSRQLSKKEQDQLDLEKVKASLNSYVESLAEAVDADWHNSYEETHEMIVEWFNECGEHAAKVIQAATKFGAGFGHAHEILKCIKDTWLNINLIPFRSCPRETLNDSDFVEVQLVQEPLRSIEDLLQVAWPVLLARSASDVQVSDSTLKQMLKDAHDHGVANPQAAHESEPQLLAQYGKSVATAVAQGRQRLEKMEDWTSFPCTVKKHRMRRCIDRRFEGSDDQSDSDCGFGLNGFLGF